MTVGVNRRRFAQLSIAATAVGIGSLPNHLVFAQDSEDQVVVSVSGGPGDDELSIVHAQGETVIKKNPGKIVSYDIASIQTIEYLGGTLAGVPELSGNVEWSTSAAEVVGSLFEPDYEAVYAMAPDLIIVAGRSAAVYEDLEKIAPTIDVSYGADMMESFTEITMALGTILGAEEKSEEAIAEVNDRVATLQAAAADAGSGMMIMVSGGALTALAPGNARGGRGALIYNVLGITPPVEYLETATHGEPISFEFILEHNPDWLFVIDRDAAIGEEGQAAQEVLDNEIIHETEAYRNGHIVYVNPFDWYIITGASVPSFFRMLDELDSAFGI